MTTAYTPESLMVRTEDVVRGNLWRMLPAINCDYTDAIPSDYPGPIGVPITYLDKHDPERFKIVCMLNHGSVGPERPDLYRRIIIRNLHPELPEVFDIAKLLRDWGVPLEVVFVPRGELPSEAMPVYRRCTSEGPAMVDGRAIERGRSNAE